MLSGAVAWKDPGALKADFGSASFVGDLTVFNVGGNKYRLIAFVHYRPQIVYIKHYSDARGVRPGGMEAMNTTIEDLDLKRYGRLLARALPKVIKTEEENERALAAVESVMEKGEKNMSPEDGALLELLTHLIHDFEEKAYPIPKSEPHAMVAFLLEQRGLAPKDLWPVVGSKSRVSEILSGKREMTKEQAKRLAEFFHVGVELFI